MTNNDKRSHGLPHKEAVNQPGNLKSGVTPEDALRAFMQVDPEAVKRAEKNVKTARKPKKDREGG
jgi:hypothetical protein